MEKRQPLLISNAGKTGQLQGKSEIRILFHIISVVAQSCPTLFDPVDCSPPGSSVHGILQGRILESVAISFSRGSSDPGIEPGSPASQADALPSEPPGKPIFHIIYNNKLKMD